MVAEASLIVAGLALAQSAYSAKRGHDQSRNAAKRQQQEQDTALAEAASQSRKSAQATAAANRKRPDMDTLLTDEMQQAQQGAGATMLTGAGGVDTKKIKLGQASLLG